MKFYCVTSTVYNDGRMTAAITREIESDTKPQDTSTSTSRRDIYNDWFDTLEAAESFVDDCRKCDGLK